MRIYIVRWVVLLGLTLLATAGLAVAQSSPAGGGRPGSPPNGSSQQQGLGGPAGGSQQQQEQQQRRQRMQQSSQPGAGGSSSAQAGAAEAGAPAGASPVPGAPPPGTGNLPGEPSGTTTPRASLGGGDAQLPNVQVPQTGAARVLAVAPERLSLAEAVRIGLENNLATLLATERAEEARGALQQVRSFLLPNISGSAYQQNRTLNLAAQGLGGGGEEMMGGGGGSPMGGGAAPIPSFVGPFNTFDARLNFSQSILNLAALREYKSSKAGVRVAELNTELAREQVATYVALTYLAVGSSRVDLQACKLEYSIVSPK